MCGKQVFWKEKYFYNNVDVNNFINIKKKQKTFKMAFIQMPNHGKSLGSMWMDLRHRSVHSNLGTYSIENYFLLSAFDRNSSGEF